MSNRLMGKIKVLNSRGFGFISTNSGIDYYFHYTEFDGKWKSLVAAWINDSKKDIQVSFIQDTTATDGPRAINVKLEGSESSK